MRPCVGLLPRRGGRDFVNALKKARLPVRNAILSSLQIGFLSKKKHGAICRSGDGSGFERWKTLFEKTPERLTKEQKQQWLEKFSPAVLGSDGYIPFRDSIDRAVRSGVRCVVQPGGSTRDAEIIAACGEYGIAMAFSSLRLFHH